MYKKIILWLGLVILLVTLNFSGALKLGFTNWDDNLYVTENLDIIQKDVGGIWDSFTVGLYTPIVSLSYILDKHLFGMEAKYFHLTQLILHVLNTLLLGLLLQQWFRSEWLALSVTLLFSIHPIHFEPVVWISSRKDLLFSLFYLLAAITYTQFIQKDSKKGYYFSLLFIVLSSLSKPTAMTFPVLMLGFIWFEKKRLKISDVLHLLPFFLVALATGMVAIYGAAQLDLRKMPDTGYNWYEYLSMGAYTLQFYFQKTFFSWGFSAYHAYPLPGQTMPWYYLTAPMFLIALAILMAYTFKKERTVFFCLLASVILLGPTIRIYPAGYPMVAERYFYLGLFPLLCIPFHLLASHVKPYKMVSVVVLVISSIVFLKVNKLQMNTWKSDVLIWNNVLKQYPDLYFGYMKRAEAYEKAKEVEKAYLDYKSAYALQPGDPKLLSELALKSEALGKDQDALKLYDELIRLQESPVYFYNRGNSYKKQGIWKQAIQDYSAALKLDPQLAEAWNNRGVCYIMSSDTLSAYRDFTEATRLVPNNQMYLDNLTRIKALMAP
jgi:protein O-mannosyl-transferase